MVNVVKGTVWADAGKTTPVDGRMVRAYRADTGWLLGSLISGAGDPAWAYTSLFIVARGEDDSQNITDVGPLGVGLSVGSENKIKTVGGNKLILCTNSPNSRLTVQDNATAFTFGTGDFGIRAAVRLDNVNVEQCLFDFRAFGVSVALAPMLYFKTTGRLSYYLNGNENEAVHGMSSNTLTEVEVSRIGGQRYVYANGVRIAGPTADTTNYTVGATRPRLAYNGATDNIPLRGYLRYLQVVKGVGFHSAASYTPSEPSPAPVSPGGYWINTGSYSGEVFVVVEGTDDPLTNHQVLRTNTVVE